MAGIDSGSTSTDVVILDKDGKIKSTMIIPTGGGAMMSAENRKEETPDREEGGFIFLLFTICYRLIYK